MPRIRIRAAILLAALLALPAGPVARAEDPALEVLGGGFLFNYRVARAYYGIVVRPTRPLPAGATIEAAFEDPAGGPPLIETKTYTGGARRLSFTSPPVGGVVKDRDYTVTVRVKEPGTERVVAEIRKTFRSDLDAASLPDEPAVVGPGFHPNTREPPL